MKLILTVAAAAALIALPASAQSTRIDLSGKSAEQVNAHITMAAKKVCRQATTGASFPREMYAACYKATVADATAKADSAQFAAQAVASRGSSN